jgi:hypothetical protein
MMLLNAIPRVILAPLFVIWLGIELPSKIALAVVLVAVLIFFAVYSGIRDVNQLLVDRVRTLGGGRLVLLREVYIPSVTAWVLGSLKVAVCLYRRGGRRVRGGDAWTWLSAPVRSEYLQRSLNHGIDLSHHGFCAGAVHGRGGRRAAAITLALSRRRSRRRQAIESFT